MVKGYIFSGLLIVNWLYADDRLTALQQARANSFRRSSVEQQIADKGFIRIVQAGINDRIAITRTLDELASECLHDSRLAKRLNPQIQDVQRQAALLQDTTTLEAQLCQYQQESCKQIREELLHKVATTNDLVQTLLLALSSIRVQLEDLQSSGRHVKPSCNNVISTHKTV